MPAGSAAAALVVVALLASGGPEALLRLQDPALLESSGLAASARHDDVLWTHADGGEVAQVRAVDGRGRTVATVTLAGIDPYDPEAMAPGVDDSGVPALFLADIGDNLAVRPDVSVYRLQEPRRLRDQKVVATWYRFTYPDGPHDAEALLVHPRTGRLLIATKGIGEGGLYRAPRKLVRREQGTNRLERISGVPPFVTDGAYLPDGRFVLRTYGSVHVYDRPGHQVASARLPAQPQGESLAVRDGALLVGSEGERSAVYEVPVPGRPTATPDASDPTGIGRTAAAADEQGWRDAALVGRAGGIAAVLVLIVVALRRSRRR
jgi:hypothetical protein